MLSETLLRVASLPVAARSISIISLLLPANLASVQLWTYDRHMSNPRQYPTCFTRRRADSRTTRARHASSTNIVTQTDNCGEGTLVPFGRNGRGGPESGAQLGRRWISQRTLFSCGGYWSIIARGTGGTSLQSLDSSRISDDNHRDLWRKVDCQGSRSPDLQTH